MQWQDRPFHDSCIRLPLRCRLIGIRLEAVCLVNNFFPDDLFNNILVWEGQ